jgi:hypothetical protein
VIVGFDLIGLSIMRNDTLRCLDSLKHYLARRSGYLKSV